jgi:predicted RNase H-like HicB family nuclease
LHATHRIPKKVPPVSMAATKGGSVILASASIPTYRNPMKTKFTAILRFEEDWVVALSPELDIASQGTTPKEALSNLKEAVELFLETASPAELEGRLSEEAWITQFETEYAPA